MVLATARLAITDALLPRWFGFVSVAIDLGEGFICKRGDCGKGTFEVEAEGLRLSFEHSNMIVYDFDWTNPE